MLDGLQMRETLGAVSQLFAYIFLSQAKSPPPFPAFSTLFKLGSSSFPSFLCSHPSRITHRGQGFPWRKERRRRGKAEKLLRSQKPISMTDCLARPTHLAAGRTADYAHSQQESGSSRSHAISYLALDEGGNRKPCQCGGSRKGTFLRDIQVCVRSDPRILFHSLQINYTIVKTMAKDRLKEGSKRAKHRFGM